MICATILLCYLFTCCTHLASLASAAQASSAAHTTQAQHQLPAAAAVTASAASGAESGPERRKYEHEHVHRLMSQQDLRRTFQVNSHDQVPEYEILKLTVNDDGSHLISPISDLGELTTTAAAAAADTRTTTSTTATTTTTTTNTFTDTRLPHSSLANDLDAQHHGQQVAGRHKRAAPAPATTSSSQTTRGDAGQAASGAKTKRDIHEEADDDGNKLIVMNLSTFGKEIKLRLKRNADFQQRIKDMKMFMAESTKDGQLRYTEIKSHHQHPAAAATNQQAHSGHHQEQRKQEPHKREADATVEEPSGQLDAAAGASGIETADGQSPSSMSQATKESEKRTGAGGSSSSSSAAAAASPAANVWNIGSTYHDEDNLAALLIDHDRRTGQLQLDGTIGNDFVIKPMPQATIEALVQKRQQQDLLRRTAAAAEQSAGAGGSRLDTAGGADGGQPLDLARSNSGAAPSHSPGPLNASAIQHMHDDDPHDDDEMFLDEDEALELAHLQSSASIESNHTGRAQPQPQPAHPSTLPALPQKQQQQPQPPRTLSKAASERKWKKYRKLMAQTQVPKPGQLAQASQSAEGRARRHASSGAAPDPEPRAARFQVSHHIVYRQRPSSEGSSSEHQHSFMASPADYLGSPPSAGSMEQLAVNFASQRLSKRSASGADPNMIDEERPDGAGGDQDADQLHDPLGGQFYLEPGSVTGFERAGYSDWSLMSRRHQPGGLSMAPPPYLLNGTAPAAAAAAGNATQAGRRRFKRHAGGQRPALVSQVRRKRQAPDTVWPEVLLVVDYDSFLLHGGDSRDVKRYFVSFWNGVDLRYKLLVHPHIRISLAGMIVAKDRDATPYLERNRLRAPNADAVDAAGALTDMGKYLYREDRLPTYDLAVVITKLDMCRRRYEGGRCNRGTAGFAYVGGACVVNKRLEKVNSVAIIEDSGGFSGIIVAAHEVGHLLGCVHDGSPPPTYLGGPGATHCPWEDGFIMSDLRHTERGFRWSQCSIEQFKHFLNGETATCLYNYPHESQMLHRLLPGTMLSLDEQCKRDRGTNACFKDARVCAQLFCFDSASGYCVSYRPAAEGSPCGEGQVCRNGKCVGEIENIIPDYTHQSQTVVARGRSHPVGRLADNGISASSTSTATSSPDSKASVQQLTSRMDTFPIDTPVSSGVSPYTPFGGRFSSGTATSHPTTGASLAHHKGASLIDFGTSNLSNFNSNANRRSGQQAAPKAGAINQNALKPYGSYQPTGGHQHHNYDLNNHNVNQHSPHVGGGSTAAALYTSASTISHHQAVDSLPPALSSPSSAASLQPSSPSSFASSSSYPYGSTSGGNNLLTSVSTSQLAKAKSKQQQPYDNQRALYQPPMARQEGQSYNTNQQSMYVNSNNNNYNRNVNHHQPTSSAAAIHLTGPNTSNSHRLQYTSSFAPPISVTS